MKKRKADDDNTQAKKRLRDGLDLILFLRRVYPPPGPSLLACGFQARGVVVLWCLWCYARPRGLCSAPVPRRTGQGTKKVWCAERGSSSGRTLSNPLSGGLCLCAQRDTGHPRWTTRSAYDGFRTTDDAKLEVSSRAESRRLRQNTPKNTTLASIGQLPGGQGTGRATLPPPLDSTTEFLLVIHSCPFAGSLME